MFKYYNANPNGEEIGDCVIRAISLALDIDYYKVIDLLYKNSNFFNCVMLVRDCYGMFLNKYYPRIKSNNKTVEEVANDFKNNILIIRIEGHLTCSIYGTIYDIWDTSNEEVDLFWVVE
jgi:hypothetical protein